MSKDESIKFLKDYYALCIRHKLKFAIETGYDYGDSSCLQIEELDKNDNYLYFNLMSNGELLEGVYFMDGEPKISSIGEGYIHGGNLYVVLQEDNNENKNTR
jgi:hypothetical protein